MPRIAFLSKTKEEFYDRLQKMMDLSARSLKIKKDFITKCLNNGLYPYTKRYLGNFNNHFSTIGLVGMNEACLNACWLKKDLSHKESQKFSVDVLNFMLSKLKDYQEKYGDLYNLEATPAESTCYRLAKHDKEEYKDIITANNKSGVPYYTNSTHLPVNYTDDIFEALDIEDQFQVLYTSGTVFHAFLGQKMPSWKSCLNLVRKIAENYKLPYYTISPTYSVCKDHGYITGEIYNCPTCNQKTEVYSRITGYYRAIQNWNDGKLSEFNDRKTYNVCNEHKDFILFTTPTCPKCQTVKTIIKNKNFDCKIIDANSEANRKIVDENNILEVPTLLVVKDKNKKKYTNVSEIVDLISNSNIN